MLAVIVLLLSGGGFLIAGLRGGSAPEGAHPSASATASQTAAVTSGRPAVVPVSSVPVSSVPVWLRIPAMGVSVSLSQLGLNADKSPQVPTNYQQPGWYKLGPAPGMMGSAVILGHVDDKQGPAVFYKLGSLRAGDKVDVSLANGAVAHFAVKNVETYLKTQFPSQKVYGTHGYRALQLVTCGGDFDKATGHYLSNVVAFTTLISTTPPQK
jgi:sortase (surface protein transpeptidase)